MAKTYCYLRVSSPKRNGKSRQSTGSQKTSIRRFCKAHGIKRPIWIEDYQTGRRDDREGLQTILRDIQDGDQLLTWKVDRLGRSAVDTIRNLQTLIERQVRVVITSTGMTFDRNDAFSKFCYQLLSALAEMESSLIGERVSASIEHRRSLGIHVGAKPKTDLRKKVQSMRDKGVPVTTIAKRLNKSRQAIYGLLQRMQEKA